MPARTRCGKLHTSTKFYAECGMAVPAAYQSKTPKKMGRARSNKNVDKAALRTRANWGSDLEKASYQGGMI